jgi:hypothetical protein
MYCPTRISLSISLEIIDIVPFLDGGWICVVCQSRSLAWIALDDE